jgi:peptidyl-prolyl cis-trans isomerase C/peptidyl-prolyl cis-trans isomerase D
MALAQGQASGASQASGEILAIIGNRQISLSDFNRRFEEVSRIAANPPTKAQFLEELIRYEVGLQEAKKRGLEKDPVIRDRMEQELYKGFLEKELTHRISAAKISDKDLQAYYRNNPEVRSAHILIEVRPDATAEMRAQARKRAQEIFEEVRKSRRPFQELVKMYSDDIATKEIGGDLGFQTRISLLPQIYDNLVQMKPGEIRGPFESPSGFHIIRLTERRRFESADMRQLRALVFDEKRKEVFNQYFEKLKQNYTIQINRNLLK